MRVDKYLWAIRVFKTRSLASNVCKNNGVTISEKVVKPSREIKVGEIISVKKNNIWYSYKVIATPKNRVGAKLVPDYTEDVTSPEEIEKLNILKARIQLSRSKGLGRPTKKERRDIDEFTESLESWDDWDDE